MPRTTRLHELKRPKLRQDWSKWNLYNLSRIKTPLGHGTFFQQKWMAKAMLRSFHNPDVREGTWTRMFDRRLPAVVPMDHRYLAQKDGSELATGRGSGLDRHISAEEDAGKRLLATPYLHMAMWPLERRLDSAIFRALFASSVRQARQMVIHGFVKVNGKKMEYPGYQLNPGDMFSVDPERVMFATGTKKLKRDEPWSRSSRPWDKTVRAMEAGSKPKSEEVESDDASAETAAPTESATDGGADAPSPVPVDGKTEAKGTLQDLAKRARRILDDSAAKPSAKRRQDLRGFRQQIKTYMSKMRGIEEAEVEETVEAFETAFADILAKLPAQSSSESEPTSAQAAKKEAHGVAASARRDAELLHAALEKARMNPIDATKPYATPWSPRPYMSAFAFIPRYLEVNHNICSAVYVRHPVARPGLAEVPTPFSSQTMALGFNWYLRRR